MTETMRSVIFKGQGTLEIEDRAVPQVESPDDIILRVKAVGICGSDLHILDIPPTHPAKPGVIFGHEFCGEVVETGTDVKDLAIGDLVAIDQNPPCGRCASCRTGSPNFCEVVFDNPEADESGWSNTPGQWWDGGMAEYVRVPSYFAYPVGDTVPMEQIVVAEPLGCVLNGVHKAGVEADETVVIMGGGPVGLLATMAVKNLGAGKVIVVEPAGDRRRLAEEVGADVTIDPSAGDVAGLIRRAAGSDGPTLIYEAVGSQLDVAVEVAANEARIVVVGINSSVRASFPVVEIVKKELRIFGAFLMRYTMQEALDLIQSNSIAVSKIVTHVLPLKDVHEGIRLARSGEAVKVVFTP
jgi:threonine dehydrogenase-like Zn-dependent dehydrogenase